MKINSLTKQEGDATKEVMTFPRTPFFCLQLFAQPDCNPTQSLMPKHNRQQNPLVVVVFSKPLSTTNRKKAEYPFVKRKTVMLHSKTLKAQVIRIIMMPS